MAKQFAIIADLGSKVDPTVIGVVEIVEHQTQDHKKLYVAWLVELFKHEEMDWTTFIPRIQKLQQLPELKKAPVIVDANGVGDVVVSYMKKAKLNVVPVLTTAGQSESVDENGALHVAKSILVSTFMQSLNLGKWKFSENLAHKEELLLQFENFQMKIKPSGQESFENARDSIHDDMVTMCLIGNYYIRRRFVDVFRKPPGFKKPAVKYNPRAKRR